jgi:hypothetical protein
MIISFHTEAVARQAFAIKTLIHGSLNQSTLPEKLAQAFA